MPPTLRDFDYFDDQLRPQAPSSDIDAESLTRLKQRRRRETTFFVAVSAFLVMSTWFLWDYRAVIRYAFLDKDTPPLLLGDVTSLRPDQIAHNSYVALSGITEHRGLQQKVMRSMARGFEELWYFRLVGSQGIFIEAPPDAEKYGYATEVNVVGRVVDPEREPLYQALLKTYSDKFFPRERTTLRILQVGVRPADGRGLHVLILCGIVALVSLNAWSIIRLRQARKREAQQIHAMNN